MILLIINLIIYYYSEKNYKTDLISKKKIILIDPIEELLVDRNSFDNGSIGPAEFDINLDKQLIVYKTKGARGTEDITESFMLGPGQRELFDYFMALGNRKISLSRNDFLNLKIGDIMHVELAKSEKILVCKKIESSN